VKRTLFFLALLLFSLASFAQAPPAPERIVYHLGQTALPKAGKSVVELEVLRKGETFLVESHSLARGGTAPTVPIALAAGTPEVRRELLALSRTELRSTLELVVRVDGKVVERLPFRDVLDYDRLLRADKPAGPVARSAPLKSLSSPATAEDCENQCYNDYDMCRFTTPSCQGLDWCPQCEDQLNTCLLNCPISNPCTTDLCLTCGLPFTWTDDDADVVPDRLEYYLAHQFFPNILLQRFEHDLSVAYVYKNWAMPFTVQPVYQGMCDQDKECLEIRYGTAYTQDYGDNILGISSHFGDNEFYVALVQRTTDWATASTSASYWRMIRDFTAAHWSTDGDSSRYGAYGHCPPPCGAYANDEQSCTANSKWCSWSRSLCYGISNQPGDSCINHWEQEDCRSYGCYWKASSCTAPVAILCDSSTPVTTAPNFYAAERKHGIYHTDWECEMGGLFDADACPYNAYNLRNYKGQKLQNVGTEFAHSDSIIQYPDGCYLYDVWSGIEFGGTNSNYRKIFKHQFNWYIPITTQFSPTGGPIF
jgi:hypothetical protein